MNQTVSFVTLGCRVNQYEEQWLREEFLRRNYTVVPFGEPCDCCVINTCAVTAESERKSRNLIGRAAAKSKKVLVVGCYAELANQRGVLPEHACYVGGCRRKHDVLDAASGIPLEPYVRPDTFEECDIGTMGILPHERYRAYVKIQDGCNGNCSYCVIPRLRGPSVSRPHDAILAEAKRLAAIGVCELILTGIETSDYEDVPLPVLINEVCAIPGIARVRLGSLNIRTITPKFLDVMRANPNFCPHLHLSVQSGSTAVLNAMQRPYTAARVEKVLDSIRNTLPQALISADIISGFPGETEAHFEETLSFLRRQRFSHIHAFPYSPRPFTDAAEFPDQVPDAEKHRRNDIIVALSAEIRQAICAGQIGQTSEILVEKTENGRSSGHTPDFLEADIACASPVGSLLKFNITSADDKLHGIPIA